MPDHQKPAEESQAALTQRLHSATQYVKNALENAAESTSDATQSLINNIMNKKQGKNEQD